MYPEIIVSTFRERYAAEPAIIVRAPGRINLIGEHTDYNNGFVLPASIDKAIYFAASAREDSICRFYAENFDQSFTCDVEDLKRTTTQTWANYLMGVISEIQKDGHQLSGIDLVFGGDIPNGAGVSSSAAVEGGMACVLDALFGLNIPKLQQVRLAQRAENNFVGVNCGIMDMFASIMGKANACIKIDCRSLDYEYFPFNAPDYTLILCDTGVKHSLVDSEYNTRRSECEEGVRILKEVFPEVNSLRDVSTEMLFSQKDNFPKTVFLRCKYVVEEIDRVTRACNALNNNQLEEFGRLMYQTHDGLQHEYGVSCEELDFLVENTRDNEAVLGARMMGGGFGGCTINLVLKKEASDFVQKMKKAYLHAYNRPLPCHEVALMDGVEIIVENEQ